MDIQPVLDRVVIESDPPDMVHGVALPNGYSWRQAKGRVLSSNASNIPVGSVVLIVPGAGERVCLGRDKWVRFVEEWDCLAILVE